MSELEIELLKARQPVQGPPPDMKDLRGGYSSPSELKRAAQTALLELQQMGKKKSQTADFGD